MEWKIIPLDTETKHKKLRDELTNPMLKSGHLLLTDPNLMEPETNLVIIGELKSAKLAHIANKIRSTGKKTGSIFIADKQNSIGDKEIKSLVEATGMEVIFTPNTLTNGYYKENGNITFHTVPSNEGEFLKAKKGEDDSVCVESCGSLFTIPQNPLRMNQHSDLAALGAPHRDLTTSDIESINTPHATAATAETARLRSADAAKAAKAAKKSGRKFFGRR